MATTGRRAEGGKDRRSERLKEWIRPFYLKWLYFRLRPDAKPGEWRQCWEYPEVTPSRVPDGGARPLDIVVLPMTDWHARRQRAQQLCAAWAAAGHRCFYLNPHLGREFPRPVWLSKQIRVCEIGERIWEIHAGLRREPVFHHRLLDGGESDAVAQAIGGVLEQAGARVGNVLLIVQLPVWTAAADALRRRFQAPLVYDCHDWLRGFSAVAAEIVESEEQLLREADLVAASAKSLLEKLAELHPWLLEKSAVVRNGVDVGRFGWAGGSGRTVAGYAGAIEEWFDADCVREAAMANPQCDFVILGRIENPRVRARLGNCRNVRFFGEIPHEHLPSHMARFDIGLIPFAVNPLTEAANPIKLYEYFSCGLPVVSTRLPEVEAYGELVYIARDPADFARQVRRALEESGDTLRIRRREVAVGESWDSRAGALLDAVAARKMGG